MPKKWGALVGGSALTQLFRTAIRPFIKPYISVNCRALALKLLDVGFVRDVF